MVTPLDSRLWEHLHSENWTHMRHLESLRVVYGASYLAILGGLSLALGCTYDQQCGLGRVLDPWMVAFGGGASSPSSCSS